MPELPNNPSESLSFNDLLNLHRSGRTIPIGTVIAFVEHMQQTDNSSELLSAQGLLLHSLGSYSEADQRRFVLHSVDQLDRALTEGRPQEVIAFVGFVGIARDVGNTTTDEGRAFWKATVEMVRELNERLESLAQQDPATWGATFELVAPGLAWMEFPFGATSEDDLQEARAPKVLEQYDLIISMQKLDKFINGKLGIREIYGPGGMIDSPEENPLLKPYELATSIAEKTLAAAQYLERAFREDLPGEFELAGTAEEISDKEGRIRVNCTPRAKRLANMARVVSGVKKVKQ